MRTKIKVLKLPSYIHYEHKKTTIFPSKQQQYAHFKQGLYSINNRAFYILDGVQYDYSLELFKNDLDMLIYKDRRMHEVIFNALSVIDAHNMLSPEQKSYYHKEVMVRHTRRHKIEFSKIRKQLRKN